MAWENLAKIYGQNVTFNFNETGPISLEQMRNNEELQAVSKNNAKFARQMIIQYNKDAFGRNNEYAHIVTYDINDTLEHVDPVHYPLNVYGTAMINDYITLNNITFDKN